MGHIKIEVLITRIKCFDIIIHNPKVSPISYSYNYIYKTINGT